MVPAATLVLDNEAVQALADVRHPKHRRALAFLEVTNQRGALRRRPVAILVPVAVRVEAGWNRSDPRAALVNRVSRARDVVLDGVASNRAAALRQLTGVSVVDATVGQVAEAATKPVAVLTSDVSDMQRLATLLASGIEVIRL